MEIELVKAQENDIDFLMNLRKSTIETHLEKAGVTLSEEEHLSRVTKNLENSFIVRNSKEKVGLLKLAEDDSNLEITQLQILPEFQNEGIGKHLIEQTIEKAKAENKELRLKVLKRNPAKFLYLRSGFKIIDQDNLEFHMQYVV